MPRNRYVKASGQKLPYDIPKDLRPITQVTSVFYVVYVPPSLPAKAIKELISYAIVEALQATDVVQRSSADGSMVVGNTPEQLGAYIRSDMAKWKKRVQEANLQLH